MAKNEEKNPIENFKGATIDLNELNALNYEMQLEVLANKLKDIYKDNLEVTSNMVDSVYKLKNSNKDEKIYLPHDLEVSRKGQQLEFKVAKRLAAFWLYLGIGLLLLALAGAIYFGARYFKYRNVNIDIDGDGIADINIDLDGDGKPDVNIDTDGDGKPDLNIDYKGNRKPTFNIDTNGDGKPDFNLINQTKTFIVDRNCKVNCDINGDGKPDVNIDTNNDGKPDKYIVDMKKVDNIDRTCKVNCDLDGNGTPDINIDNNNDGKADENIVKWPENNTCDINCDTNDDGWPDTNLDLDGDGIPDSNIDNDGDGVPDGNIDLNGDGICDLMCDTDGDGKCDINCINPPYDGLGTGSSTSVGDPKTVSESSMLVLRYGEGETINVENLVPNDQPYVNQDEIPQPYKTFSIENLSVYTIEYNLVWKNVENTFVTDNLKYKVTSTNGGFKTDYLPTPKKDGIIAEKILIPPKSTQEYRFDFSLFGTGVNQNVDQGKKFSVLIDVET